MSYPPGWYAHPDGGQGYWDGQQWTQHVAPGPGSPPAPAAGPAAVPHVRHRRNHAVAGLGFILSGLLIGFGATQTVANFSGPPISITLLKSVGLSVTPSGGFGLDESVVPLMLSAAVALVVFGLLLLVTRIRYLGLVWRLGGLVALFLPAFLAISYWSSINDPITALQQGTDNAVADAALEAMRGTRGTLWDLSAAAGLYIVSAGVVCGIIAALIPAIRRTEAI